MTGPVTYSHFPPRAYEKHGNRKSYRYVNRKFLLWKINLAYLFWAFTYPTYKLLTPKIQKSLVRALPFAVTFYLIYNLFD